MREIFDFNAWKSDWASLSAKERYIMNVYANANGLSTPDLDSLASVKAMFARARAKQKD
jgi:hypothetical protein